MFGMVEVRDKQAALVSSRFKLCTKEWSLIPLLFVLPDFMNDRILKRCVLTQRLTDE